MKKLVIAALAATAFVSAPAFAQTDFTTITANVGLDCAIDAPNDSAVALTGTTALASDLIIRCNSAGGFNFSLTSANGWQLEDSGTTNSPSVFPYELVSSLIGGSNGGQDFIGSVTQAQAALAGAPNWLNNVVIPVSVNITDDSDPAYAGTYQDVLTWTISAN